MIAGPDYRDYGSIFYVCVEQTKQLPIKNLEIPEFKFYGTGMKFYVEVGPKVLCFSRIQSTLNISTSRQREVEIMFTINSPVSMRNEAVQSTSNDV